MFAKRYYPCKVSRRIEMTPYRLIVYVFFTLALMFVPIRNISLMCFAAEFNLTYANQYPPSHQYSRADMAWIEKIEKETQGRVKIKPFWAGSLISSREATRELSHGVCDIAQIQPIYEKSGMDLIKAHLQNIVGISDPMDNLDIWWKVYNAFPEMQKELKEVKLITIHVGDPMHLCTTKKPVRNLEDLKGLKLRLPAPLVKPMAELGVQPVSIPMNEAFIALQKGIAEGVTSNYETLKTMRHADIAKYYTMLVSPRGAYPSRAMNWNTWNKLPKDIQKIISDSSQWWSLKIIEENKKDAEEGYQYAVEKGVEFIEVPKEDQEKWTALLIKHARLEAERLDEKGLPGSKMFLFTRGLVEDIIEKRN